MTSVLAASPLSWSACNCSATCVSKASTSLGRVNQHVAANNVGVRPEGGDVLNVHRFFARPDASIGSVRAMWIKTATSHSYLSWHANPLVARGPSSISLERLPRCGVCGYPLHMVARPTAERIDRSTGVLQIPGNRRVCLPKPRSRRRAMAGAGWAYKGLARQGKTYGLKTLLTPARVEYGLTDCRLLYFARVFCVRGPQRVGPAHIIRRGGVQCLSKINPREYVWMDCSRRAWWLSS